MFKNGIVLTGSIASGKSTTCNLLKLYGFTIIDADKIAHETLNQQSSAIASLFGKEFVENGVVNRKRLGQKIFNDKEAKRELEKLLHPLIKKEIIDRSQKIEKKGVPYIIDIPLFFETKNYDIEKVAVVYAPKKIILERLIKREGMSEEEAKKRIEMQIDIEEKRKLATFVIDNSSDLKDLQKEVEEFVEKIYKK